MMDEDMGSHFIAEPICFSRERFLFFAAYANPRTHAAVRSEHAMWLSKGSRPSMSPRLLFHAPLLDTCGLFVFSLPVP